MSPLEQWLIDHRPHYGHTATSAVAPFAMDPKTGKNVRKGPPLTHTELWAALIADSDYLEPFDFRGQGEPAVTVAGPRSRLGAAHHV